MYSSVKDLNSSGGKNRFKFEKFSTRKRKVDIDIIHRVRAKGSLDTAKSILPDTGVRGCYFQDELERLKELDTTSVFKRFYYEVWPYVQSLPELIHHVSTVVDKIDQRLKSHEIYQLSSFLQLISVLARDLEGDLGPYFHRLFKSLTSIVHRHNTTIVSNVKEKIELSPEICQNLFECMSYLLKYQISVFAIEPDSLRQYYGQLLGHPTDYIRDYSARTFSIILRKLPTKLFRTHLRKTLIVMIRKSFLPNQIDNSSNNNSNNNNQDLTQLNNFYKQIKVDPIESTITADLTSSSSPPLSKRIQQILLGISLTIFQTTKGIRGCLHSTGSRKLQVLLQFLSPINKTNLTKIESIVRSLHDLLSSLSELQNISENNNLQNNTHKKSKGLKKASKNTSSLTLQSPSIIEPLSALQSLLSNIPCIDYMLSSITGHICADVIHKLMRYLHPSNSMELWLCLITAMKRMTQLWKCLNDIYQALITISNLSTNTKNNGSSSNSTVSNIMDAIQNCMMWLHRILENLEMTSLQLIEILYFAMNHSNGRGLSDQSVAKAITDNLLTTCYNYMETYFILQNNEHILTLSKVESETGESSTTSNTTETIFQKQLSKRTVMLFCSLWRKHPNHKITHARIQPLFQSLLATNSLSSSELLRILMEELLVFLPEKIIKTNVMQPLLQCTLKMASENPRSSAWLSILIDLLYKYRDPRDDVRGSGSSSWDIEVEDMSKKTQGHSESVPLPNGDSDGDGENGDRNNNSNDDALVVTREVEVLSESNAELTSLGTVCLDIIITTFSAAKTSFSVQESELPQILLACKVIAWLLQVHPFPLDTTATIAKLHKILDFTSKLLLQFTLPDLSPAAPSPSRPPPSSSLVYLAALTGVCCQYLASPSSARTTVTATPTPSKVSKKKIPSTPSNESTTISPSSFCCLALKCLVSQLIVSPCQLSVLKATLDLFTLYESHDHVSNRDRIETVNGQSARRYIMIHSIGENLTYQLLDSLVSCFSSPSYWIRITALRIASFIPLPLLQLPDDANDNMSSNGNGSGNGSGSGNEKQEHVDIIQLCLEAACTSLTIHTEREYARRMGKLEVLIRSGRLESRYIRVICGFCLGQLHQKFKPVWEPAILTVIAAVQYDRGEAVTWPLLLQALEKYSAKGLQVEVSKEANSSMNEDITDDSLVSPCRRLLEAEDGEASLPIHTSRCNAFYFRVFVDDRSEVSVVLPDARTDFETVHACLWDVLKRCPAITLRRSKVVVPIFIRFLKNYYYHFHPEEAEYADVIRTGLFNTLVDTSSSSSDSSTQGPTPTSSDIIKGITKKRLIMFLSVFSVINSPKQLYQHQLLYSLYQSLLSNSNHILVKLALECIFTYKSPAIIRYQDSLNKLLVEKEFRNELIVFDLSEKAHVVEPSHRAAVIPVVVSIVFGMISSKSVTGKSAKKIRIVRRTAVMSFLSKLSPTELVHFIHLILRNLIPKSTIISTATTLSLTTSRSSSSSSSSTAANTGNSTGGDNFTPNSITDVTDSANTMQVYPIPSWCVTVQGLCSQMTLSDISGLVWEKQVGFLHLLEEVISQLGFSVVGYVGLLSRLTVLMLMNAQQRKQENSKDNTPTDEVDDDVDAEGGKEGEEEEEEDEAAYLELRDKNQASKVRSLCLSRLAELVEQYSSVNNFPVLDDIFWEAMTPLLLSLPTALRGCSHPPALLRLILSCLQHPNSESIVLARPAVVVSVIYCLSVKTENEVSNVLLEILSCFLDWNEGSVMRSNAELLVLAFSIRLSGSDVITLPPLSTYLSSASSSSPTTTPTITTTIDNTELLKISDVMISPQSTSFRSELSLLCRIATEIFSHSLAAIPSNSITNLATLLLGMIRVYTSTSKMRVEEQWMIDILTTYQSLLPKMKEGKLHLPFISKLFGPCTNKYSLFNLMSVRAALLQVYQTMASHGSLKIQLALSSRTLSALLAIDVNIVEGRDFDKCMPVFQALSQDTRYDHVDGSLSWSVILGPQCASHPRDYYLLTAVLHEMFRCMYDGELVVRTAALASLKQLVDDVITWETSASNGCHSTNTSNKNTTEKALLVHGAYTVGDDGEASGHWLAMMKSLVIPFLWTGLKTSTDIVKKGFILFLAHIVSAFGSVCTTTPPSPFLVGATLTDIFHTDLVFLRSIDQEQDFFENITHVQLHRRMRMVMKLRQLLTNNANDSAVQNEKDKHSNTIPQSPNNVVKPIFTNVTLTHVLLPIAYHPLMSDEFQKKEHSNLLQESSLLLGAIALHLGWSQYYGVIKLLLRKLEKGVVEKEKILLSSLCAVLDSFHFELVPELITEGGEEEEKDVPIDSVEETVDDPTTEDLQQSEEANEVEDDEEEGEVASAIEKVGGGPSNNHHVQTSTSDSNSISMRISKSQQIAKAVMTNIIPWVKAFLLKKEKDHKGNSSTVIRTPIALALTKLLKRLLPPVISAQRNRDLFVNLVISVVGTLKGKDVNARDTARDSLAKMVVTMGLDYLYPVLYELKFSLTEGYQRHVRNYSLRSILEIVLENYVPPANEPSYTSPTPITSNQSKVNSNHEDKDKDTQANNLRLPVFDQSLPIIMSCVLDDLSGDLQEDREVDGAIRSLIREAKGTKSYEILELVSRCLLFRPTWALSSLQDPASISAIHAVTSPLLSVLANCESKETIGRVGEALQRVALGLSKNESLNPKELFLYLHATIQPFILMIVKENQKNSETKRRRKSITKAIQQQPSSSTDSVFTTSVSDDDDDALDACLPSYLRQGEGEGGEEQDYPPLHAKPHQTNKSTINGSSINSSSFTTTWLPGERREHVGQRGAIEERDREMRERNTVLDGASAPILTGRNRHKRSREASHTEGCVSSPSVIAALKFCLSLLSACLRRNRLNGSDAATRSMSAPFIPLLGQCLRLSGVSSVVAISMRCLCTLLSWGLHVSPEFSRAVGKYMLKLMCKGGALISTDSELVQACLRGLTALFQQYVNSSQEMKTVTKKNRESFLMDAKDQIAIDTTTTLRGNSGQATDSSGDQTINIIAETKELESTTTANKAAAAAGNQMFKMPLKESHIRALLSLLLSSVTEVTATFQNAAFQLIKVMVDSKLLFPEIYDLMTKLSIEVVQSHRKGIREAASTVLVTFLLNYPLGEKRRTGHMKQLINNCSYDYEEGRLAALELLLTVCKLLPVPVLDDCSLMIFLPMTLRLVNDKSLKCRETASAILLTMLRRISPDVASQFLDYSLTWMNTFSKYTELSLLMEDRASKSLIKTGAQICVQFVEGRVEVIKKNNYLMLVLNSLRLAMTLMMSVHMRHKGNKKTNQLSLEKREMAKTVEETVNGEDFSEHTEMWSILYHLLILLEKLFIQLPTATDYSVTHPVDLSAVDPTTDTNSTSILSAKAVAAPPLIMELVQEALVYPHAWIRAVACRIIHQYLLRRNASKDKLTTSPDGAEFLTLPNGLYHLGRRLCLALNQPNVSPSLLEALVPNMVFVIQAMSQHPELCQEAAVVDANSAPFVPDEVEGDADGEHNDDGDDDDDQDEVEDIFSPLQNITEREEEEEEEVETVPFSSLLFSSSMSHSEGSGEFWVMRRLRGIATDPRGSRRHNVVKIFSALVASETEAFIRKYLHQFIEVCLRVHYATKGPDESNDKRTREACDTLLESLERKVGSSVYIGVFQEVQSHLQSKRHERKQQVATEAVYDPRSFAEKKLAKNVKKKESKKRKKLKDAAIHGLKRRKGIQSNLETEEEY